MARKGTEIAEGLVDPVVVAVAHKESLQPLGGDVAGDVLDIASRPRGLQGIHAHVGSEDLDGRGSGASAQILNETHGEGIHLFTACAARDPYADGDVGIAFPQDARKHRLD